MELGLGLSLSLGALSIVGGATPAVSTTIFGEYSRVGEGPMPFTAPDGVYGPFTVSGNIIDVTANDPAVGTYDVNGTDFDVVANSRVLSSVSALANYLGGAVSPNVGETIYLRPGSYDTAGLTNTDRDTFLNDVTFQSTDPNNKAILNKWYLPGPAVDSDNITFIDIAVQMTQPTRGEFWGAIPSSVAGFFGGGGGNMDNWTFTRLHYDGGLLPVSQGGALVADTVLEFRGFTNVTVEDSIIENCSNGIGFFGVEGGRIENCTFDNFHSDPIRIANGQVLHAQDIDIINNHFGRAAGDTNNLHSDNVQILPQYGYTTQVRRIKVEGNTSAPGIGPFMSQVDAPGVTDRLMIYTNDAGVDATPDYVTYVASGIVNIGFVDRGRETRIQPVVGTGMTVNLPAASLCEFEHYQFRYGGSSGEDVTIVLDGSDTWDGSASNLVMDGAGQFATFVSDGVSNFAEMRAGYRTNFHLLDASRTLSDLEEGDLIRVDASGGNITVTLPSGSSNSYGIVREDTSANTVTVVTSGGENVSRHGTNLTSIDFPVFYGGTFFGDGSGWAFNEKGPTNYQLLANNPGGSMLDGGNPGFSDLEWGAYLGIMAPGQIALVHPTPNFDLHHITLMPWNVDDLNGDGLKRQFEGASAASCTVQVAGDTTYVRDSVLAGNLILTEGARGLNNVVMNATIDSDMDALYAAHYSGIDWSSDALVTRQQVIDLFTARGDVDPMQGGRGTTDLDGYYNWATGAVNTGNLPVPSVVSTVPAAGEDFPAGGEVVIQFDQFIMSRNAGNVLVQDRSDDSTVETFDIVAGTGDQGGTIVFDGARMKIILGATVVNGVDLGMSIPAGVLVCHDGVTFPGQTDTSVITWTIDNTLATAFTTYTSAGEHAEADSPPLTLTTNPDFALLAFEARRADNAAGFQRLFNLENSLAQKTAAISVDNTGSMIVNLPGTQFRIDGVVGVAPSPVSRVLIALDRTEAVFADAIQVYVDEILVPDSDYQFITYDDSVAVTWADGDLLAHYNGLEPFEGDVNFIYFDTPATAYDLSVAANRTAFAPYRLLPNGAGPTGSAPELFMHETLANKGTAGAFSDPNSGITYTAPEELEDTDFQNVQTVDITTVGKALIAIIGGGTSGRNITDITLDPGGTDTNVPILASNELSYVNQYFAVADLPSGTTTMQVTLNGTGGPIYVWVQPIDGPMTLNASTTDAGSASANTDFTASLNADADGITATIASINATTGTFATSTGFDDISSTREVVNTNRAALAITLDTVGGAPEDVSIQHTVGGFITSLTVSLDA